MKCQTPMLGRVPSIRDPDTIPLRRLLAADIQPPPPERLWQTPISDWGVMGNNQYGNCVIVTAAHMLLTWRANELQDATRLTDSAVIDLSRSMRALNGYSILDRLKYWRKTGMWGDYLWAFAYVPHRDQEQVKIAINHLGGLDIGINLPAAWRGADEWTTGSGPRFRPNSWGPHSVPLVGYNQTHVFAATWGEVIPCTWDALAYYCDEGYALIDPNWIARDSISPSGIDLNALHAALCEIGANAPQLNLTP